MLTGAGLDVPAAPIWSWREIQNLEGLHGAVSGSMSLFQLSSPLHDRSVSVLSNIPLVSSQLSESPLPSVCTVTSYQDEDSDLWFEVLVVLCTGFLRILWLFSALREWAVPGSFPSTPSGRAPESAAQVPKKHHASQHSVGPLTPSGRALVDKASSWSAPPPREWRVHVSANALSNHALSLHQVYVSWLTGGLTKECLDRFAESRLVDSFLSVPVDSNFLVPSRSQLLTLVSCASWPGPQQLSCPSGSLACSFLARCCEQRSCFTAPPLCRTRNSLSLTMQLSLFLSFQR